MIRLACKLAFSLVALCLATAAQAQTFPSRPVTIVSPYQAGGTSDIIARILAHVDFLDESPAAGMQFIPKERYDIEQRLPLLPAQLASQIDEHLGQRIQFA